jgi:glutaredoxin 3
MSLRLFLLIVPVLFSCSQRSSHPDRSSAPDTIASLLVNERSVWLYSFFDERAELRTVDQIGQVPQTAKAEVMVTNPKKQLPGDLTYIADLRAKNSKGEYRTWVETRGAWLDRQMPKLSLLKQPTQTLAKASTPPKHPRKLVRRRRRPRAANAAGQMATEPRPAAKPKVMLFSTSWCPSCKTARQYFESRGVPFLELDVEKDPQAAQQYMALTQSFGLRQGVVPLIVINGRPMQGFSQSQVEAALASMAR